jgi:predicted nucleotidyltransferase
MLRKTSTENVLEVIFKEPTRKFTIRELARITDIAPPTALRIVRALIKEEILNEAKVATASQISANLKSETYKRKKKAYNIESTYSSGLLDHLLKLYHEPKAIILFGSYARGEDIERSDIDIAIITAEEKSPDLKHFEKELARTINIHETDLSSASQEFKNNLYNGIVLYGAL